MIRCGTLLAAALLVLAGCGGGERSNSGDTLATDTSTLVSAAGAFDNPTEPPSNGGFTESTPEPAATALLNERAQAMAAGDSAAAVSEPVATGLVPDGDSTVVSDFETGFTVLAPGWSVNWWGTTRPDYVASRETRADHVSQGTGAQRFRLQKLPVDGGAHLVFPYGFIEGRRYVTTLSLRADVATSVEVQVRRNARPYDVVARKVLTLGTAWTAVSLDAVYPYADAGTLRVIPSNTGVDVYLDGVTIAPQAVTSRDAAATAPALGGITLPAAGGRSETTTLRHVVRADEAFKRFGNGWYFNATTSAGSPDFMATRETRPDHVYAGASSQKFEVRNKNGSDVHLIASFPFVKGKTYRATMFLRADAATPVQVFMRMDAPPWQPFGTTTVTLTNAWQKVTIEGTYVADVSGSVRIALKNPTGTLWADELTIEEVERNDMAPVTTAAIPDTLFGMHVNKLGVHQSWPGMETRILRLWNTGTTWRDLESVNNQWNFARLDMYVDYARERQPGAQLLYTLGQTPTWASSTPRVVNQFGAGAGGAPTDMGEWRDYVRTLARRYAGRIRYWELWNEADYLGTYNGTIPQLVELARIASEELKAADPANQLVSPGFTNSQGIPALDSFLASGGKQYVDIIGFHWYYSTNPESIAPSIDNVRNVMANHGIANKPLWNTEGAFICNSLVRNCTNATPTTEEARSANARAMLIMASRGIANFNYYTWEATAAFPKLVEKDYVTPTVAATAFGEARGWVRGAKVIDAYRIEDKVYVLRLARGTIGFVILWATQPNTLVNLPSAWTVSSARRLDGSTSPVPANRQLNLGVEPVLLAP